MVDISNEKKRGINMRSAHGDSNLHAETGVVHFETDGYMLVYKKYFKILKIYAIFYMLYASLNFI